MDACHLFQVSCVCVPNAVYPSAPWQQWRTGEISEQVYTPEQITIGAALWHFRRMWLRGEPTEFCAVRNRLRQHASDDLTRWLLDSADALYQQAGKEPVVLPNMTIGPQRPPFPEGVSPADIVDWYIHGRLAHAAPRKGQVGEKQRRLDQFRQAMGRPYAEWLIATSYGAYWSAFRELGDAAQSFLLWCYNAHGVQPSFPMQTPLVSRFSWLVAPRVSTATLAQLIGEDERRLERNFRTVLLESRFEGLREVIEYARGARSHMQVWEMLVPIPSLADWLMECGVVLIRTTGPPEADHFKLPVGGWARTVPILFGRSYDHDQGGVALTSQGRVLAWGRGLDRLDMQLGHCVARTMTFGYLPLWTNRPEAFSWRVPAAT